jgi:hypothetical protein
LSKTGSTSNPFFSKSFASFEIQGIHNVGDSVDTPQQIVLSGRSCAVAVERSSSKRLNRPTTTRNHRLSTQCFPLNY